MKKLTINTRVLHIFIIIGLLFFSLSLYMTYFELYGKQDIISSGYNRRLKAKEQDIQRGLIYDRQGVILADTDFKKGVSKRIYPHGRLYAHVIGYNSETYGKSMIEAQYNDMLLSKNTLGVIGNISNLLKGDSKKGNNLSLTIDHKLQARARELLGNNRGAIVAIEPNTGEILAMVSTPDFNPNEAALKKDWNELSNSDNRALLPRAISGLYPPGSTFKVVTAVAAIEKNLRSTTFEDKGSVTIDGKVFSNAGNKAYGTLDMTSAMAVSSNVYFAQLSEQIGAKDLVRVAERIGINSPVPFDLPVKKSSIQTTIANPTELAATAIGQGKLLVTPFQMALMTAGIANEGVIMKPYLVKSVSNSSNDFVIDVTPTKELYSFTDRDTAGFVRDMMIEVVKKGTGKAAKTSKVTIAGKTGTAENEKTGDHAWFVGFAPADEPQIAIAIIIENQSKTGGQIAAPIARKLMTQWISQNQ